MPIYEYQCLSCETTHEMWQKSGDQPKTLCPKCGGNLRKLLSVSSFSVKGGGWYADGYASVKPGQPPTGQHGQYDGDNGGPCHRTSGRPRQDFSFLCQCQERMTGTALPQG